MLDLSPRNFLQGAMLWDHFPRPELRKANGKAWAFDIYRCSSEKNKHQATGNNPHGILDVATVESMITGLGNVVYKC